MSESLIKLNPNNVRRALNSSMAQKRKNSVAWLVNQIRGLSRGASTPGTFNRRHWSDPNFLLPGEVIMYFYDPKTKEKLKYYDTFPIVIPLSIYNDGFLGLNLHYLPLAMRMSFFNKLMQLTSNPLLTPVLRMRVTYELLKTTERYKEYKPCIKRYLINHVRSDLLKISPVDWELAAYLPFAQFMKANQTTVHQDSREIIQNG